MGAAMQVLSLQAKIAKVCTLIGNRRDISAKDDAFLVNMRHALEKSKGQVMSISDAQIDYIDSLYDQHFG